jgi:Bacterial SH3 domain.
MLSTALRAQTTWVYADAYDGFVNVRKTPSTKSEIIEVMYNNKEGAKLLAIHNKWWYRVQFKGKTGYVSSTYTILCDTTQAPTPIEQKPKKKNSSSPSGLKVGMTTDECLRLLGEPDEKSESVYYDHINEHWYYKNKYYLIFRNGVLTNYTISSNKKKK